MSGSGFRGRGFGQRGARTNGPNNSFNGPRFPHPNFNHSRPSHRLSGPEKWADGPNYPPWQQNKNYGPRSHFRGNLQFRPNGRGRGAGGRGIVRFSGPGRPPALQYCNNFARNLGPRAALMHEEQTIEEDKIALSKRSPLLGSAEERQQKITETADKLKQKLSSITEEDLTNFWEDDLSILPNSATEEEDNRSKIIPELRHEPPELDLTFTDFRDIGRVDSNNLKFDSVEDTPSNDDPLITFESEVSAHIDENEVTIINEDTDECLTILDSVQADNVFDNVCEDNNVFNESDVLLENDNCPQETFNELSNAECNLANLRLQCNELIENRISLQTNDIEDNFVSNMEENVTNLTSIQPITNVLNEESVPDLNETCSMPVSNNQDVFTEDFLDNENTPQAELSEFQGTSQVEFLEDQNVSQVNFFEDQNISQFEIQETNIESIQDSNLDTHENDQEQTDLQIQNDPQINVLQEEVPQISGDAFDPSQNNSFNLSSDENVQTNVACDSAPPMCSNYNEVHKLNNDPIFNAPPHFQPRGFNAPPRFAPRIPGPRSRWAFQQNGKNTFFRGSQRLPFHGNRMTPSRHVAPFTPTDLIPIPFDPRAPPPFTPNIPASSHDAQHHAPVPFPSSDLPLSFDPSAPPPNMRSIPAAESPNKQEVAQTVSPTESRNQTRNAASNNIDVMQPPPAFDPRGPPPNISNVIMNTNESLPEFNPQQPPPKIHKRDDNLQPPPIFDPRLSSQERSQLMAPMSTSGMMGMNLTESSQMPGFNMNPVAPHFSQPPPINVPHQAFIPNLPVNFQPVLPQTNTGPLMVAEYPLPLPPMDITNVPLPPIQKPQLVKDSAQSRSAIMEDDGLEDMQEAMEFAKQIMNMTGEMKSNQNTLAPEASPSMLEIPVPNVEMCSTIVDKVTTVMERKQRKKLKAKKNIQSIIGPEFVKQEENNEIIDDEQNQEKNSDDVLLTDDQIRPKVIFNLNSKTKMIQKSDERHKPSTHVPETRESTQQIVPQNTHKERRTQSKRHSSENRKGNTSQNRKQQKERSSKTNPARCAETRTSAVEKSNDVSHRQDYNRDLEKLLAQSSSETMQKSQRSKKENRKVETLTSESSWKNRVISRFLKMSKNDICNMVNNSSLRKFDIAMKHLVKERRSSLSLEMRNTEDEKMKEYDREEFMNQLNAMLDSGAVVGITDLPTEFIHHLSEVLQLEPMPFEAESSERETTEINEVKSKDQIDTSKIHAVPYLKDDVKELHFSEYSVCENTTVIEHELPCEEELVPYHLNAELNLNVLREGSSSSRKSLINKPNPETENMYKKQQPLFNEADLDDILLQVTEKTKNPPNSISIREKLIDVHKNSLMQTNTEVFECNAFPQIPNETAADLDDIFSAGIARVKKSLNKKSANSDKSRTRKSTSEDRNTFRSERYERWNRKEREEPDTFRNLTKEEWEAKYGSNVVSSTAIRKTASTSAENLSKDSRNYHSQRYCSSDSPMRNLSLSPLAREPLAHNPERSVNRYNELEESQTIEQSESSSNASTSSSSDTEEEDAVSPNVTKLLKVIKEKEKIAKKKSLNETIRDEVAAEIEKKWKEKSKHKERKSRKREKRKRDRKEKRKKDKEKKKRRKRSSHSNTSKSSEHSEEFRLLTEDEIKKEVVVKQEPASAVEEAVSYSSGSGNNAVPISANKPTEPTSRAESQSSQTERQVPVVTCDKALPQAKTKPTIISITTQSKTKAQLKQMPESIELMQKLIAEKSTEVLKSSSSNVINVNNEKTIEHAEKSKDSQMEEGNDQKINAALPANSSSPQADVSANNSLPQINISTNSHSPEVSVCINPALPQTNVSINNPLPQIAAVTSSSLPTINVPVDSSPQINASTSSSSPQVSLLLNNVEPSSTEASSTNTENATLPASNITNIAPVINATQSASQNTIASLMPTENKSGYKKIDIKAYKERALQRRLKEEAKLKNGANNSAPSSQELQHTLPLNKTVVETEKINSAKERVEVDVCNVQIKDPRLAKIRLSRIPSWKDLTKEVREKSNSMTETQQTDILRKDKELRVSASTECSNESLELKFKNTSATRKTDSNLNPSKDSVKSKECKNEVKSTSQEKLLKEDDARVKTGFKIDEKKELDEKKLKKLPVAVESTKFKNIRSEGSKELKLKKEKAAKSEQKKKLAKCKSSLVIEKHAKQLQEKMLEGGQKPTAVNINSAIQANIERTSSCDSYESNPSEHVRENSNELTISAENTAMDHSINNKVTEEQINNQEEKTEETSSEEKIKQVIDDNEEAEQQIVSQIIIKDLNSQQEVESEKINSESDLNNLNSKTEKNIVTEADEDNSKNLELNEALSESILPEQLDNTEEGIEKEALPSNQAPLFLAEEEVTEKKSEENTVLSIVDLHQDNHESHSSEDLHLSNEENITKDEIDSISAPHAAENSEAINNNNGNSEAIENSTEESEVRSPGSSSSPFKGFLAESVEVDIRKVSQLINIKECAKDVKRNDTEIPEKLMETCLNNELGQENVDDQSLSAERKEIDKRAFTCMLTEEDTVSVENNNIDKTNDDHTEAVNNVEPNTKLVETEDNMEGSQYCNSDGMHEDISHDVNLDSQDTFDENEPFIILDEYIGDTDERSMEKLSPLNLDLEDCIARDAEMFANKSSQEILDTISNMKTPNFDAMHFNELSETFDKDNVTSIGERETDSISINTVSLADTVAHEAADINAVPSNLHAEPETMQRDEAVSIIPEILVESSRREISIVKDIIPEFVTSQEPCSDVEKIEENVLPLEPSAASLEAASFITQDKFSAPEETVSTKSLENFNSVIDSALESKIECLESDERIDNSEKESKEGIEEKSGEENSKFIEKMKPEEENNRVIEKENRNAIEKEKTEEECNKVIEKEKSNENNTIVDKKFVKDHGNVVEKEKEESNKIIEKKSEKTNKLLDKKLEEENSKIIEKEKSKDNNKMIEKKSEKGINKVFDKKPEEENSKIIEKSEEENNKIIEKENNKVNEKRKSEKENNKVIEKKSEEERNKLVEKKKPEGENNRVGEKERSEKGNNKVIEKSEEENNKVIEKKKSEKENNKAVEKEKPEKENNKFIEKKKSEKENNKIIEKEKSEERYNKVIEKKKFEKEYNKVFEKKFEEESNKLVERKKLEEQNNKVIEKEKSEKVNNKVIEKEKSAKEKSAEENNRVVEKENNKLDESHRHKLISMPSKEKRTTDKEIHLSSTVEHKSTDSHESLRKEQRVSSKSHHKEFDETLHRVKSKTEMKHKQAKKRNVSKKQVEEAIQSDTVKLKYPNTKESIMARMIAIDVEIHKLMSEKMTLYQMLTNDALPVDNDFQPTNTSPETKEIEATVVRPRTPSALMSQLIQNIETSPVTTQCAKTTENVPSKKSPTDSLQSNKSKVSKHEHSNEKRTNCVPIRGSDYEEFAHHTVDSKYSSSKKRKKSRWAIKWKDTSEDTNNASSVTSLEEKEAKDETKSILKKISKESSTCNSETPNNKIHEKTVELTEFQVYSNKLKALGQNDENALQKDNDTLEALHDTDTASSVLRPSEFLYSDDSTWDSVPQNSSVEEYRRPTTGLALLEEKYRREIAQSRKRTETRKRKRKRIQSSSSTRDILTPEEEELPLSTLYFKKRSHHRKRFHSSLDQQAEKSKDDQLSWSNIDEVINAVAENRTEELYAKKSEGQTLNEDNQSNVPDSDSTSTNKVQVNHPEMIQIVSSTSQSIDEVCVDPKGTNSSNDANDASNDSQLASSSPDKSQESVKNEEQDHREVLDRSDKSLEVIVDSEGNVTQVMENDNGKIDPLDSIEKSESSIETIETNANNTSNNQSILDVPETNTDSEKPAEENRDGQNEELDVQEEAVNPKKNVSSDVQEVLTTAKYLEENRDNSVEPNHGRTVETADKIIEGTLNENTIDETENVNEEIGEDTSSKFEGQSEKDNTDDTIEQLFAVQREERLLSAKEHRRSQKRRESERSNRSSNEENNSNRSSVSSTSGTTDTWRSEEMMGKRAPKRKRGSSRTPLRRSCRYTEETMKRVKVESDPNIQGVEQEPQEKHIHVQPSNVASTLLIYDEETENTPTNGKKNRSVQKSNNRKRCMPFDAEILSHQSVSSYDSSKDAKRCKQLTVPVIMNCEVRLVDSKHTILKPNVDPNVLRKYGISTINSYVSPSFPHVSIQPATSSVQSTSAKDSSSTKQASKSVRKLDEIARTLGDQITLTKVKKGPRFAKVSSPVNKEKGANVDAQMMPVLTREQVVVDISQECEKPDIEIVEEKMIVTKNQPHNDCGSTLTVIETKDDKEPARTQYTVHKGPILDIKVFENSFLAASEDGKIYRYSQTSNGILNIYKGHQAAVTCLYVHNGVGADGNKEWMFSGSLDGTLRCYNISTSLQMRDTADIGSPIQCMDEAWGIIFIGTKSGHVLRYPMKTGIIKGNSIQFSDKSVLALKATNEGPRKVLIVASRSQPITIRDAQTGLFLRTVCGQKSHTVYSLMRDHNLIYCGTSSTSILVFDFTNGEQMMQYDAGVGIVCMRLYKQLLFAGCYDGNIYVFDTKDCRLVCSIPGPGNMLLSMEIIDNKIIAGSKDKRLQSWQMPRQVRSLL